MLHAFSVQNFHSFADRATLSLVLNKHAIDDQRTVEGQTGKKLTKALVVIGANASGKTSLVKSLAFVDWFIKHSFQQRPDEPIPLAPHFAHADQPSMFELEFEMDRQEWLYSLSASTERVWHESLHVRQTRNRSYVFLREWDPVAKVYAVKQQQFGMLPREAEKVRQNASLIATAAQYDVPLARRMIGARVFHNLSRSGRSSMDQGQIFRAAQFYADHPELRKQMATLLQQWDLGLQDIVLEKHTATTEDGKSQEVYLPFGVHRAKDRDYKLIFLEESSGSQGAFLLLSRILPALASGGVVMIDELEADLHPHMLTPVLDLFFSEKTNPHNAQIVFTCHSMEVLTLLSKSQVVIVEKDADCESSAYRLDSVKGVRSDDNLYAKYMAGAYGGVPQL